MVGILLSGTDFKDLALQILHSGNALRFQAHGGSMRPFIHHGDLLEVEPIGEQGIRRNDIVLCSLANGRLVVHRVVHVLNQAGQETLLVQGDGLTKPDGLVPKQNVLGRVTAIERRGKRLDAQSTSRQILIRLWNALSPFSKLLFRWLAALRVRLLRRLSRLILPMLALLLAGAGVALVLTQAAEANASSQVLSGFSEVASTPQLANSPPAPAEGLRLLESNQEGILLELSTPAFQLGQKADGAQACQVLRARGYFEADAPGQPGLPVKGVMLGIPPGAAPVVTILEADLAPLPGSYRLCPQPSPIVDIDLNGQVQFMGETRAPDPQAYSLNQFIPSAAVELVATGFIRSQAIAQLRFQPFQYNPATGELRSYRSLRVRVSWSEQDGQPGGMVDEGPFEAVLRDVLLNYATARAWRAQPANLEAGQSSLLLKEATAYKVFVNQDGIYQITYDSLQAAGAPVDELDPRTLRLFNQGSETAIAVSGEQDGAFDPGDTILFYGQKTNTRYTDTNVYWLTWGYGNGRRMPVLDGAPGGSAGVPASFRTRLHLEEEHYYQPFRPSSPYSDRWYWDYLSASNSPVTRDYHFSLQNLASVQPPESLTITLRGVFRGFNAIPQHHTRVLLNGHEIDNAFWPSEAAYTFEVTRTQAILQEGDNTLSVIVPKDDGITLDQLFVNWFEIEYWRDYVAANDQLAFDGDLSGMWKYQVSGFTTSDLGLFDVTMPFTPSQVANFEIQPGAGGYTLTFQQDIAQEHHYIALAPTRWLSPASIIMDTPSDLRSTGNAADYIIVTHGDFYTDVLPLADWRQAQGLRVKVVDVQDVYDEFSAGIFNPQAIHDFLAYAYANWQPPAPTYVLLVGDGNYDFKNFMLRGEANFIPPYLADVDPWTLETDADNRFVTVAGDDILPDLFLGRLPVKTRAEASAMVAKILGYEQNPPVSGWIGQTLFVADNADSGGEFAASSDMVADHYLPAAYTAQKVYYGVTHLTPAAAHTAILEAINQGRLLVNYAGHASIKAWASENLFTKNDIPGLANGARLPFVAPMTCLDGYFIHPSPPGQDSSSLGESIVRAAAKGAIASWSPTGLGLSNGHDYLDRGLFQALFHDDLTRLGPATTQAKLFLFANTGGYRELIDTYLLFGDPALALNTLPADVAISLEVIPPGVAEAGLPITYVVSYTNSGLTIAHHVLISETLAAQLSDFTVISSGAAITPVVGSRLSWQVADLAPSQGGVITVTAVVGLGVTQPISNTAAIFTSARQVNWINDVAGPVYTTFPPWIWFYFPMIYR